MNILSIRGRRLNISLRLERIPGYEQDRAAQAFEERGIRKAVLDEKTRREFDQLTMPGRV